MHTHRHTHACAHTHTCTHTHTHIYIYIYIHMCMYMQFVFYIAEGSLGVKLPTIWTDGKAEVGRVRRETVKRKKIQVRGKLEESRNTVFFPRAFERRVLLVVGVCQTFSHLHIFTSSHNIFKSSHLLILASSHLHISHLHILTSSHPHPSSHLLIFTSTHLHIFSS